MKFNSDLTCWVFKPQARLNNKQVAPCDLSKPFLAFISFPFSLPKCNYVNQVTPGDLLGWVPPIWEEPVSPFYQHQSVWMLLLSRPLVWLYRGNRVYMPRCEQAGSAEQPKLRPVWSTLSIYETIVFTGPIIGPRGPTTSTSTGIFFFPLFRHSGPGYQTPTNCVCVCKLLSLSGCD